MLGAGDLTGPSPAVKHPKRLMSKWSTMDQASPGSFPRPGKAVNIRILLTCSKFLLANPFLQPWHVLRCDYIAHWIFWHLLIWHHLGGGNVTCHISISTPSPRHGDGTAFMEIFGNKWVSQSQGGRQILEFWRYLALVLCPVLLNAIAWNPHYMAPSKILEWTKMACI